MELIDAVWSFFYDLWQVWFSPDLKRERNSSGSLPHKQQNTQKPNKSKKTFKKRKEVPPELVESIFKLKARLEAFEKQQEKDLPALNDRMAEFKKQQEKDFAELKAQMNELKKLSQEVNKVLQENAGLRRQIVEADRQLLIVSQQPTLIVPQEQASREMLIDEYRIACRKGGSWLASVPTWLSSALEFSRLSVALAFMAPEELRSTVGQALQIAKTQTAPLGSAVIPLQQNNKASKEKAHPILPQLPYKQKRQAPCPAADYPVKQAVAQSSVLAAKQGSTTYILSVGLPWKLSNILARIIVDLIDFIEEEIMPTPQAAMRAMSMANPANASANPINVHLKTGKNIEKQSTPHHLTEPCAPASGSVAIEARAFFIRHAVYEFFHSRRNAPLSSGNIEAASNRFSPK